MSISVNPMDALIEADHINKTYGSLAVVQEFHLQVAAGEIYGLIGPDGAGKTTTLRLLCGGLRPDPASKKHPDPPLVRIAGFDLHRQPEQAHARIGYLAQRFALYEDLTVLENIRFFAELRGLQEADWRPRCLEILEFVGLSEFKDRLAGQLSGGMKQKLGLAAALVHRPQVLLLDEPTTGVDPVTRQDFWQLIIHLAGESQASGKSAAILVSTPYMDEAARCTRVGFMAHGACLLEGAPGELRRRLEGRIIEVAGASLHELRRLAQQEPGIQDVHMFGDRLHLRLEDGQARPAQALLARLEQRFAAASLPVSRLRLAPPQLEDVFMELLESQP